MKMLTCGLVMSLGVLASGVEANQILTIDGQEHTLSSLTEKCQSITGDPSAQIACFGALSTLLEQQSGGTAINPETVTEKLNALQAVAQYQDADTGLSISGTDCNIHILYFNNYFHISRRNVSTIDLYSVQFDVSDMQYDQTVEIQGAAAPLMKGVMKAGTTAAMRGGIEIDSSLDNFEPRSARTSLDVYATEVADQLPPREGGEFEFVLVHQKRSQAKGEIRSAFEAFVKACQG